MPNDTSFLDEMSAFLRKSLDRAPSAQGDSLSTDFGVALEAGLKAARSADSVTDATRLAMSATETRDDDVRGAAAMAAFIMHAYIANEDPFAHGEGF